MSGNQQCRRMFCRLLPYEIEISKSCTKNLIIEFSVDLSKMVPFSFPDKCTFLTCFERITYSLQANEKIVRGQWGWSTPCVRFPSSHNDNPPAAKTLLLFPESLFFLDGLARHLSEWERESRASNQPKTCQRPLLRCYADKPMHI